MRRVLVTGAAGFVGANLVRRLLSDGHEVHALVPGGARAWRLAPIIDELVLHDVDLLDSAGVAAALASARADGIFHLAAHGAYSWQTDTQAIFATNTLATARLLDQACAAGVEAVVLAGSSSEYGLKDHAPDESEALEPNSTYAVSKAAATHYAQLLGRTRETHIVTLRLYSAFGPWEEPNRLMPTLAVHGLQGRLPPLVAPQTARDFVYVDDVCDAFVAAASKTGLEPGTVLNVGTGTQTTLRDVVELVRGQLGVEVEPQWGTMAARAWDTSIWSADPTRIRSLLGWEPRHGLADGFKALVEWLSGDAEMQARYARAIGLR